MHEALAFRNSRDALGDFSQLYAVPWYRPTGKTRFPPANHPQLSILVYLLVTLVLKIWVLGIPHFKKPSNIIYIYHIYIIIYIYIYIYHIYIIFSGRQWELCIFPWNGSRQPLRWSRPWGQYGRHRKPGFQSNGWLNHGLQWVYNGFVIVLGLSSNTEIDWDIVGI